MHKIPVTLERRQFDALRLWARREGRHFDEAVRQAVDNFIAEDNMTRGREES